MLEINSKDIQNSKEGRPDKLVLSSNGLTAKLACFTGQQGDFWVSVVPSINVSGYGKTEKEASEDLRYNIKVFCDDMFSVDENVRKAELSKLGWTSDKIFRKRYSKSYIDENGVLQNFDFPEKVKRTIVEAV